jgi:hypothetical protein
MSTILKETLDSKTVISLSSEDGILFYVDHERLVGRCGWFNVSRTFFDSKDEAHCYLIDLCNALEA